MNTTSTTPEPAAPQAFDQLPDHVKATAARVCIDILWAESGFALSYQGDVLVENCTSEQIESWMDAFDCGVDSVATGILAELVAAEQVIQVMGAQMSDKQKLSAAESLVASGFPFLDASRCQSRRAAIAAARKAGAA